MLCIYTLTETSARNIEGQILTDASAYQKLKFKKLGGANEENATLCRSMSTFCSDNCGSRQLWPSSSACAFKCKAFVFSEGDDVVKTKRGREETRCLQRNPSSITEKTQRSRIKTSTYSPRRPRWHGGTGFGAFVSWLEWEKWRV